MDPTFLVKLYLSVKKMSSAFDDGRLTLDEFTVMVEELRNLFK